MSTTKVLVQGSDSLAIRYGIALTWSMAGVAPTPGTLDSTSLARSMILVAGSLVVTVSSNSAKTSIQRAVLSAAVGSNVIAASVEVTNF